MTSVAQPLTPGGDRSRETLQCPPPPVKARAARETPPSPVTPRLAPFPHRLPAGFSAPINRRQGKRASARVERHRLDRVVFRDRDLDLRPALPALHAPSPSPSAMARTSTLSPSSATSSSKLPGASSSTLCTTSRSPSSITSTNSTLIFPSIVSDAGALTSSFHLDVSPRAARRCSEREHHQDPDTPNLRQSATSHLSFHRVTRNSVSFTVERAFSKARATRCSTDWRAARPRSEHHPPVAGQSRLSSLFDRRVSTLRQPSLERAVVRAIRPAKVPLRIHPSSPR